MLICGLYKIFLRELCALCEGLLMETANFIHRFSLISTDYVLSV